MDPLSVTFANNLRLLREERRLSLDALAKLSGVSKSMLGQIERGEATPTIATLWKIANGLKLPFSQLLSRPKADFELVEKASITPLLEDDGRFRNYPVFPYESGRRFELYDIEMDKDCHLESEPHPPGTQEFLTVFSGKLLLAFSGHDLAVKAGTSARFRADVPHAYTNVGGELCRLSMVIYYPE